MPKPIQTKIEELEQSLQSTERLLEFHRWLLSRFESNWDEPLRTSLVLNQADVIRGFEKELRDCELRIRDERGRMGRLKH